MSKQIGWKLVVTMNSWSVVYLRPTSLIKLSLAWGFTRRRRRLSKHVDPSFFCCTNSRPHAKQGLLPLQLLLDQDRDVSLALESIMSDVIQSDSSDHIVLILC